MCSRAIMKASGRQEFVIQTKGKDIHLQLHSNFEGGSVTLTVLVVQGWYAVASECR